MKKTHKANFQILDSPGYIRVGIRRRYVNRDACLTELKVLSIDYSISDIWFLMNEDE